MIENLIPEICNCNKSTPSVHKLEMLSQPSSVDHQCLLTRKNQNLHPLRTRYLRRHCYLHHCHHLKMCTKMLPRPTEDHNTYFDLTLLFNFYIGKRSKRLEKGIAISNSLGKILRQVHPETTSNSHPLNLL